MKKLLFPLLAATLLVFTLAGCSNNAASNSSNSSSTPNSNAGSSSTSQTSTSNTGGSQSSNPDDSEDVIRNIIENEFKDMFGYDRHIERIGDTKRGQTLSELGISNEDYCRALTELYSYEIKNIKIDGDLAEVDLQFKGPSLGESFDELVDKKIRETTSADELDKLPAEEVVKLETKAIYDILKNKELPIPTRDVKQFYVKTEDRGWVLDKRHEGCVSFADLAY